MEEEDTLERLDYIVKTSEIPVINEQSEKEIVVDSFSKGHKYFSERVRPGLQKIPLWKFWSIINHVGRIIGAQVNYNWDGDNLDKELNEFSEKGEVTGDLSRKIDYIIITSNLPKEHIAQGRKSGSRAVIVAHDYVCSNIVPKYSTNGDLWDEYHLAELKSHMDLDLMNELLVNYSAPVDK